MYVNATLDEIKQLVVSHCETPYEALPEMEVSHVGPTGYIDYLKPGDMPGSMARGVDPEGRPFIAVRMIKEYSAEDAEYLGKKSKTFVMCLHQRYSDTQPEEEQIWVLVGLPKVDQPLSRAWGVLNSIFGGGGLAADGGLTYRV